MTAIRTRGLTKRFGEKTAVDGLDLTVEKGELFALLGVNGAGKTTAIRMLSCLSVPTAGECSICGFSCQSQQGEVKRRIGLSPQDTAVAENLTVQENLTFMAQVYGLDRKAAAQRTEEIIALMGLGEVVRSRAKTLSGGWKRRLSIAMALIGRPEVLFLDEPTLGLDVLARRELWRVIEGLKGRITILLTTHYMEEAERLADRIAVMISGRIAACGTLAELEAATGKTGLEEAFVAIAEGSVQQDA
ncbi:MAG: ABC transporter ATP-binding protein [Clostridia bacterium]|nr:ABC transporter ATP-binding protein [Clostridia bacterium]